MKFLINNLLKIINNLNNLFQILFENMFEKTLLMDVIDSNSLDLVKKSLEEHPEELNKVNDRGYTSLMYAIYRRKNYSILEYLVKKGADVNIQDKYGKTALMYALTAHTPYSYSSGVINLLINNGANIYLKDNNSGMNALDYCTNIDIFKFLIKRKDVYTYNITLFNNYEKLKVYSEIKDQLDSEIIELYKCSRDHKSYISKLNNDILSIIENYIYNS